MYVEESDIGIGASIGTACSTEVVLSYVMGSGKCCVGLRSGRDCFRGGGEKSLSGCVIGVTCGLLLAVRSVPWEGLDLGDGFIGYIPDLEVYLFSFGCRILFLKNILALEYSERR